MSTRSKLVATFNSGFKLSDSGGGYATGGHTYAPLKDGFATIVRYTDGHVDVINWMGGPDVPSNVVYARQNLPLIVNDGKPNPNLNDSAEWGATLGNAALVWRSAVGVDKYGNMIYAAGPDQGLASLASTMIHAGAVRAMELDINTYWTSFISYRFPGAAQSCQPAGDHGPLPTPLPRPPTIATSSPSTSAERAAAALAIALSLAVTGCGASSAPRSASTAASATQAATTSVATSAPARPAPPAPPASAVCRRGADRDVRRSDPDRAVSRPGAGGAQARDDRALPRAGGPLRRRSSRRRAAAVRRTVPAGDLRARVRGHARNLRSHS